MTHHPVLHKRGWTLNLLFQHAGLNSATWLDETTRTSPDVAGGTRETLTAKNLCERQTGNRRGVQEGEVSIPNTLTRPVGGLALERRPNMGTPI